MVLIHSEVLIGPFNKGIAIDVPANKLPQSLQGVKSLPGTSSIYLACNILVVYKFKVRGSPYAFVLCYFSSKRCGL